MSQGIPGQLACPGFVPPPFRRGASRSVFPASLSYSNTLSFICKRIRSLGKVAAAGQIRSRANPQLY